MDRELEPNCCDKCGRTVLPQNDMVRFDEILRGNPLYHLFYGSRHLLPVVEDGKVVCEGSPSRAQYLEGQPKDTRPGHKYDPAREYMYRAAYRRLQHIAMAEVAYTN